MLNICFVAGTDDTTNSGMPMLPALVNTQMLVTSSSRAKLSRNTSLVDDSLLHIFCNALINYANEVDPSRWTKSG